MNEHAQARTTDPRRARAWNLALSAKPGALDLRIPASRVDGTIPTALRGGRMLVNGPGWNVIGGTVVHPFDGHGYVRALSFAEDGGVRLRARFVETPSYLAESAAGRVVHRGLGTNVEGSFLANLRPGPRRNVANTTIFRHRDRLLAGWEGGAPYALDPDTLETLGEALFGGVIAGQATLAHMRRDPRNGRLVLASVANGPRAKVVFRELGDGDRVEHTHAVELPGPFFCHDFALTEHFLVVAGNPLRLVPRRVLGWLAGRSTLLRALETDREKTPCLHLVPRDGSGRVRTIRLPEPGWVVHFGSAFERGGEVVVDACVLPRFVFGEEFGYRGPHATFEPSLPDQRGPQRLLRTVIAPGATEAHPERLAAHGVDFPRVHPAHEGRETDVLFGATRGDPRYSDPFDAVIRVELGDRARPATLFTAPEHAFVSEPIPVPSRERDGVDHVLAVVHRPLDGECRLVVLDARALDRGPVASVPLPLLPISFHGDWDGPP